jgi:hypothetical protein
MRLVANRQTKFDQVFLGRHRQISHCNGLAELLDAITGDASTGRLRTHGFAPLSEPVSSLRSRDGSDWHADHRIPEDGM